MMMWFLGDIKLDYAQRLGDNALKTLRSFAGLSWLHVIVSFCPPHENATSLAAR